MGIIYLISGLNWWFKMITPYPSISDFVHSAPPPDVVGAMIQNGVLFHLVKATELLTGIALLANRFVPLMLVAALPVTIPIFIVDVFFIAHLRGIVMGAGSLLLNGFLLLAYIGHFRPMLLMRGAPDVGRDAAPVADGDTLARPLVAALRPLVPVLGAIAVAMGALMLGWLLVMMVQYAIDPLPLSALHPPRP
jgi:hypothetical protein